MEHFKAEVQWERLPVDGAVVGKVRHSWQLELVLVKEDLDSQYCLCLMQGRQVCTIMSGWISSWNNLIWESIERSDFEGSYCCQG